MNVSNAQWGQLGNLLIMLGLHNTTVLQTCMYDKMYTSKYMNVHNFTFKDIEQRYLKPKYYYDHSYPDLMVLENFGETNRLA